MRESNIKAGVIADQTGPLSFVGIANANVAKMVVNDINASGGLLGRRIDLIIEDSATIDSVYPLERAAEAQDYVERERPIGKVLIGSGRAFERVRQEPPST